MRSFRKELWFNISTRPGIYQYHSPDSGMSSGECRQRKIGASQHHAYTASVFINDDESGLHHDYDVGWKNLLLTNPFHSTGTMSVKTTPTPI